MQKFKFIIMENRAEQTERVNLVKVYGKDRDLFDEIK